MGIALMVVYVVMVALTLFLWMLFDSYWNPNFQISVSFRVITSLVFPVGLFILFVMFLNFGIAKIFSGFTYWYLRTVGKIGKL